MNLLSILSKFSAKDLEDENKVIKPEAGGINYVEAWELEKIQDEPRDFFTFSKQLKETIIIEK